MAIPLAPFPSKGSPVENQAGFLARGTGLLSAPSQGLGPQWPWQISFRSQLRGSTGFAPASLFTAPCCEATWFSATNQLVANLTPSPAPCKTNFSARRPSCSLPHQHPITHYCPWPEGIVKGLCVTIWRVGSTTKCHGIRPPHATTCNVQASENSAQRLTAI